MRQSDSAKIAGLARQLYRTGSPIPRISQHWRPYICPYHRLLELIPQNAQVLDVGCGAGLFLGLLAATGRIAGGLGFDNSGTAIALAQAMTTQLQEEHGLQFVRLEATAPLPNGLFDVISMIDVLHHIPRRNQNLVFNQVAAHVPPGKHLLYKDMAARPCWRAGANRLHDLVFARQWIYYVPLELILEWSEAAGLVLIKQQVLDMLWYRHELLLFQRPGNLLTGE